MPDVPGADRENVVHAHDVLSHEADVPPGRVLVIGGGMTGCDVAETIATSGDDVKSGTTRVTIVEMRDEIAPDMFSEGRVLLVRSLREKGVEIVTSATVERILDDGAVILTPDGGRTLTGMDAIVLATGVRSVNELAGSCEGLVSEIHVIGDAAAARQALDAIAEGHDVGRRL
jgi:pyruvate/2-oxoglutarate dehydrogenase complex dihydrolipoamide dehydrogenase (E3) component